MAGREPAEPYGRAARPEHDSGNQTAEIRPRKGDGGNEAGETKGREGRDAGADPGEVSGDR
ncbi:hypothetical protein SCWH03_50690 [Streptomyces pacificus]|uniref:Uncharacterized protein n=1 Tax=Streptomyces pacificus TaxID=2705029 RepID=A0A6A0B0P7_9ACTN|nr:hypothetical protein SCWH03_50690 [Streptomyces pacificus]